MKARISAIAKCMIGAGLCLGLVAESAALPTFTVNPDAIPGSTAGSIFNATAVTVASSTELIHLSAVAGSSSGTGTGTGWAQFLPFLDGVNGQNLVSSSTSRLDRDYGLYLTFDIAVSLLTGTLGLPGSTYAVTQLDYKFYADPYNPIGATANAFFSGETSPVTAPSITGTGDDVLLAFGSINSGVANLNAQGGAGINTNNAFAVCTGAGTADFAGVAVPSGGTPFMNTTAASCANGIGDAFFDTPNPFYPVVFTTFNNTSQGVSLDATGRYLAVNAAGRADFAIPEPGVLALVGLGLLGLGATRRRKSSAK